ncbi:hypothetical protein ACLOJK_006726, partial [Asimina triloba]
ADRRFWVSLLSRKVMLGCVTFVEKQNTKINGSFSPSTPTLRRRREQFVAGVSPYSGITSCRRSKALRRRSWSGDKGVLTTSPHGETEGHPCGEASSPSSGNRSSTGGSSTPVLRHPGHRVRSEESPKKRKHLVKGPTALNKEAHERLVRQDEENLQVGLTLSREEACCSSLLVTSPEVSVDFVFLELAPPPVPVMDIGVDITSPAPIFGLETSKVLGQEGVKSDAAEA